jgi:recombination DNA repair RAD52 pathway protein
MAIAGAVTDCLKRCFRQLGEQFGNSLYDKEVAKTAGLENGASNGHGSNGNGQTEKSTGQTTPSNPPAPPNPSASQTETLQYRDGVGVDTSNAAELEAFNAFKSAHQELAPASREVLRAWVASRNGKK